MQTPREPAFTEDARRWLASALRGSPRAWPVQWGDAWHRTWQVIKDNGLAALTHRAIAPTPAWASCPPDFRAHVKRFAIQESAAELLRAAELERVLATFADAGLSALVMKGTALAYSLYPDPHLRPRCDTDLLLADRDQASRAWEQLQASGYRRPNAVAGLLVSHQFTAYRTDTLGITHVLDVHWRVNNVQRFAQALDFPELDSGALPLPRLGDAAHGLGAVHSLLLACMHRVAPMPDGDADRLLWLYDIHLLAGALDQPGWRTLASLSAEKGQCTVVLDGLIRCAGVFGTALPAPALHDLEAGAKHEDFRVERAASRWRLDLENFRSLANWGARLRLLREHLLPDGAYMLTKYRASSRSLLPLLYVRRIVGGAARILVRGRQG